MNIGIFGNGSSDHLSASQIEWIEQLGKCLALYKYNIFTGGGGGIMYTIRKSSVMNDGTVISIRPEMNFSSKKEDFLGHAIASGQGKIGRVHLLVQSIDIGIAIGGGSGTLMEVIACYLMAKPIIVVDGFQKKYDPKISNLLNRKRIINVNQCRLIQGYIDNKDPSTIEPITFCDYLINANEMVEICNYLLENTKEKKHNMKGF